MRKSELLQSTAILGIILVFLGLTAAAAIPYGFDLDDRGQNLLVAGAGFIAATGVILMFLGCLWKVPWDQTAPETEQPEDRKA